MKYVKFIFGILATLIITKGNSQPIPLEAFEYEEYAKQLNGLIKALEPFNVINTIKTTILEEFEGYFQGSQKEQFISAMNEHRQYFNSPENYQTKLICGAGYYSKRTEIVEIIDKMLKVAENMSNDEFGKALGNIKAFGPLLTFFYKYNLDEEEKQVVSQKSLKAKMTDFVDKMLLDEQEYQVNELRKMQWISEIPLEISQLHNEMTRLFFQYDRKRYEQFKTEFKCIEPLTKMVAPFSKLYGSVDWRGQIMAKKMIQYLRMNLFLKFVN